MVSRHALIILVQHDARFHTPCIEKARSVTLERTHVHPANREPIDEESNSLPSIPLHTPIHAMRPADTDPLDFPPAHLPARAALFIAAQDLYNGHS